jgi:hypothetical protein
MRQLTRPTAHDLVRLARQAGYQVQSIEQLRPNRWLLMLIEPPNTQVVLFVQVRPLVSSRDVQDLAQLAGAPAQRRGILLAYQGTFTSDARRTALELSDAHLHLCTTLPPIARVAEGQALEK